MARFIPADPCQREEFTTTSLHIHQHASTPSPDTLIVFVHGWGGHGYKTWKTLPSELYQHESLRADIGLFDYTSGLRRRPGNSPELELVVTDLLDELRDLTGYRHVAFVCHSMGGVLASAALRRSFERNDGGKALANRVSCLIMLGSPRAGTRLMPFGLIPSEDKHYLVLHSRVAESNAQFLTNYVDTSVVGELQRTYHVPHFIGVGAADSVVDSFSAGFGIPDAQKRVFRGTHSGFLRHSGLSNWIVSCIKEGVQGIGQRGRRDRMASTPPLFTRFEGHSLHGEWQDQYEKALKDFSNQSTMPVDDMTKKPADEPVGLLMRVLRCDDVGAPAISEELLKIKQAHESEQIHSVGLSPHGKQSADRAREVFDLIGTSESRWIKGTEDLPSLRKEMVRWLHRTKFLISPDPTNATPGGGWLTGEVHARGAHPTGWGIDEID